MKIKGTILIFIHLAISVFLVSNLNVDTWMSPVHCESDSWFRYLVFSEGVVIFLTYLVFAWLFKYKWNTTFTKLTGTSVFGDTLSNVFIFCSMLHLTHSLGHITKWVKPALVVLYPILIYLHIKLVFMVNSVDERIKSLKTPEEYNEISERLRDWVIQEKSKMSEDFKEGGHSIFYASIGSLTIDEETEIEKGVIVTSKSFNDSEFELYCEMKPSKDLPKVILKRHDHPDYKEGFYLNEGWLYDNISKRTIRAGEFYEFQPNQEHELTTGVFTSMKIVGIFTGLKN